MLHILKKPGRVLRHDKRLNRTVLEPAETADDFGLRQLTVNFDISIRFGWMTDRGSLCDGWSAQLHQSSQAVALSCS